MRRAGSGPNEGQRSLSRNLSQHLRVCREFFEERQKPFDRFRRPVPGQSTPDRVDFLQIVHWQQ
jgi:hypothetical protein